MDVPALHHEPLRSGIPRLRCLGRLVEEKGFDLALAAFALLRDLFSPAQSDHYGAYCPMYDDPTVGDQLPLDRG